MGAAEPAGFGAADAAGAAEASGFSAFFGLRLMVTLLIFVGFTERSPDTSTPDSFKITSSGAHLPKMV